MKQVNILEKNISLNPKTFTGHSALKHWKAFQSKLWLNKKYKNY